MKRRKPWGKPIKFPKDRYTEVPATPVQNIEGMAPGTRVFMKGNLSVLLSDEADGLHLSIAHPKRFPTWEEIKHARYTLIADEVTMAQLLPPKAEFVNVHENCFHLFQVQEDRRAYL